MKKRRRKSPPRKMTLLQLIERRRQTRTLLMGAFFTVVLGLLLYRIWWYQSVWGDEYSQLAARQVARHQIGLVSRTITPRRGVITDRNNQPIARTQQVYEVFLDVLA
jgi:cell division protein FtsI/penicillin-binding protein 2